MTRFPAKLLLLGEYSILLGSSALSVPFNYFGASLRYIGDETGEELAAALQSSVELQRICDYFMLNSNVFGEFLDLERFARDILQGLHLASTIPKQYGMGSSGAVCAAVYQRYHLGSEPGNIAGNSPEIHALRDIFIRMESFFHGKSSGFDPLVSALNKALLLGKDGVITLPDISLAALHEKGLGVFLADSGQPCGTGALVTRFLNSYAPGGKISVQGTDLCTMVNEGTERLLCGDIPGFFSRINHLSHHQLTELHHLVPAPFQPVWAEGLKTGVFTMKLCGSGGGGFLLCFTRRTEEAVDYFKRLKIRVVNTCF